jgi:release factor glutamine methyltransferase
MATIGQWRANLRQLLHFIAGPFAPGEADQILREVTGANATQLTLRHQDTLTRDQESTVVRLLTERQTGRPLAYVLGHVEFYGLDLLCDERVLIPRPETEELVDAALAALPPPVPGEQPLAIDLGTGSGNIALAMAHQRPDIRVIATDLSADALVVAAINISRHNLSDRIRLLQGASLDPFSRRPLANVIVANLPYIADDDLEVEPSVHDFEPHLALYAGELGTEILTDIIRDAPAVLKPGGALVCEFGLGQTGAIRGMVRNIDSWGEPIIHQDTAGIDRILEVHKKAIS